MERIACTIDQSGVADLLKTHVPTLEDRSICALYMYIYIYVFWVGVSPLLENSLLIENFMLCICFLIFVLFFSEERAYTSDDVLIICGKYNDFLKALASRTNRVSKAMVVLAAKKVFKGESEKAICDFAAAMATCLSHCFRAADKAITGERLQPEVRDIILKFKHPKLLELQCKLRGITEGTVAIEEDDSQKVAIEEKNGCQYAFTFRLWLANEFGAGGDHRPGRKLSAASVSVTTSWQRR